MSKDERASGKIDKRTINFSIRSGKEINFLNSFSPRISDIFRDALDDDLHLRTLHQIPGWESSPRPAYVPEKFNANLNYGSFMEEVKKQASGQLVEDKDAQAILAPMMVYSGIHPADEESKNWVRLGTEFSHLESFPFATLSMFGRRVAMRAIPSSYQEDEMLRTPFLLKKNPNGEGVEVTYDDGAVTFPVAQTNTMLPPDSMRTLAYLREIRTPEGEHPHSISINPLLGCGERCSFCFRQYDTVGKKSLGAMESAPLSRVNPVDMVRYLMYRFGDKDLQKLEHIALVTGAFTNFDDLYTYIDKFSSEIAQSSRGAFDPKNRDGQSILILTHLITEKDQMKAIKELGVKDVEHTLEVIDDERRKVIMPQRSKKDRVLSKSDFSFDQTLEVIPHGIEIFGEDGYTSTALIGLDDYDTTIMGLERLHEAGLRTLSFPMYQTYSIAGIKDYAMSFPEVMVARRHATTLFKRQY